MFRKAMKQLQNAESTMFMRALGSKINSALQYVDYTGVTRQQEADECWVWEITRFAKVLENGLREHVDGNLAEEALSFGV